MVMEQGKTSPSDWDCLGAMTWETKQPSSGCHAPNRGRVIRRTHEGKRHFTSDRDLMDEAFGSGRSQVLTQVNGQSGMRLSTKACAHVCVVI
jgi:hypothetical protein